ncbi:HEAT repeat domain-containing protein [Pseudomonas sp. JQ170]|uniref:HEAT repeat domain-containing protein n=1 Tax=unclassified Pseudomonas TaxID=196821 RepID=UPI00264F218D|nr:MULTISPECIES: HEAT repeat domain-containing protein [unclassified Pseudomonas]MDN7143441.1 HEAT repeat domain-containing protein [Pseudomonas sp. JQ170]WRO73918.1 HEAT repeat domain-containing protein [Pseudomonas sp. 170C]
MISKWLFSGAVVLEAGSWASLTLGLPDLQMALLYVSSHLSACLMLTGAIWLLLPARYRRPLPWSPLFIFSLAFFVPILGSVGVIAAIFPALYLPRKRERQLWRAIGIPDLPFRAKTQLHSPTFADSGLQDVLRHAPDPDQRLAALLATRRMPGREAVPILKLALGDPSDDVRLLAYSMLDKQESDINQHIETALGKLAKARPKAVGSLHATLARWYFELAYLGLAQGSVQAHVLGQAGEHAERGLAAGKGGELLLLAGRIALGRGDIAKAQVHLLEAERSGMAAEKVLPFRAEIAFETGLYRDIPLLLRKLPSEMQQRPPFASLLRSWT